LQGGFPEYLRSGNSEVLQMLMKDIVLRHIAVRHGIRNTHGSRARGDHHKGSDIDFMLIGSGITPRLLSKMDMEIDDLLLPWFIQITDRKAIRDERFLEVVEKEGVVFWERGE
jgi:uncharacterized protein